ncbi:hypothetical protein D917_02513 [Trichinella nativa]|uniref:Uncharacterized protein n=1 Tax=Trichinella nativa TaxID=6335 RepID=A0A1Y3EE79_9BILA|nr:hypothetical protein D917_02513 [Trichinella nativa]
MYQVYVLDSLNFGMFLVSNLGTTCANCQHCTSWKFVFFVLSVFSIRIRENFFYSTVQRPRCISFNYFESESLCCLPTARPVVFNGGATAHFGGWCFSTNGYFRKEPIFIAKLGNCRFLNK